MAFCVAPGGRRCGVHDQPMPCPRNGHPPSRVPVHGDDFHGRHLTVATWVADTGRSRPLVVHHGSLRSTRPAHEVDGVLCWCRPEVIPPVE